MIPPPLPPGSSTSSWDTLGSVWSTIKHNLITFLIKSLSAKLLLYFINLPAAIQLRGLLDNVRLHDLKVNTATVNQDLSFYNFPVALKYGHVEFMDIQLYLAHSQVQVILQGLVLVFGPLKYHNAFTPDVGTQASRTVADANAEKRNAGTARNENGSKGGGTIGRFLNELAAIATGIDTKPGSGEEEEGFSSLLGWLFRYVPNIRIRIDNVFVRYEDENVQSKSRSTERGKNRNGELETARECGGGSAYPRQDSAEEECEPLAVGIKVKRLLLEPEQKRFWRFRWPKKEAVPTGVRRSPTSDSFHCSSCLTSAPRASTPYRCTTPGCRNFRSLNTSKSSGNMSGNLEAPGSLFDNDIGTVAGGSLNRNIPRRTAGESLRRRDSRSVSPQRSSPHIEVSENPVGGRLMYWMKVSELGVYWDGAVPDVAALIEDASSRANDEEHSGRPSRGSNERPPDIHTRAPVITASNTAPAFHDTGDPPACTATSHALPATAFPKPPLPRLVRSHSIHPEHSGALFVDLSVLAGTAQDTFGVYSAVTTEVMKQQIVNSKKSHFWVVAPFSFESQLGFETTASHDLTAKHVHGLPFRIQCRVVAGAGGAASSSGRPDACQAGVVTVNISDAVMSSFIRLREYYTEASASMLQRNSRKPSMGPCFLSSPLSPPIYPVSPPTSPLNARPCNTSTGASSYAVFSYGGLTRKQTEGNDLQNSGSNLGLLDLYKIFMQCGSVSELPGWLQDKTVALYIQRLNVNIYSNVAEVPLTDDLGDLAAEDRLSFSVGTTTPASPSPTTSTTTPTSSHPVHSPSTATLPSPRPSLSPAGSAPLLLSCKCDEVGMEVCLVRKIGVRVCVEHIDCVDHTERFVPFYRNNMPTVPCPVSPHMESVSDGRDVSDDGEPPLDVGSSGDHSDISDTGGIAAVCSGVVCSKGVTRAASFLGSTGRYRSDSTTDRTRTRSTRTRSSIGSFASDGADGTHFDKGARNCYELALLVKQVHDLYVATS